MASVTWTVVRLLLAFTSTSNCVTFDCARLDCQDSYSCEFSSVNGKMSCTACKSGYRLISGECEDVDECAGADPCGRDADCSNIAGSFICECINAGYLWKSGTCNDVDECTRSNFCSDGAECSNAPGSYTCTCKTGYIGDGITCTDVDECYFPDVCSSNAACENIPGSYRCICEAGYTGENCTDPLGVIVTYDQLSHNLTCTVEGVRYLHTFSPWEHRLGGILIRRLGIPANGTSSTLTLTDTLTYEDTGDYVCSVTNGIRSPQTGQVFVAPPTAAVFQNNSDKVTIRLGRTETISVSFYVRPSSGSARVIWGKAGESDTLQFHEEDVGLVKLVIHGQFVTLMGTVTILTLTNVSPVDEGNYSVTVTCDINGVTQTSHTRFHVKVVTVNLRDEIPMGIPIGATLGALGVGGLIVAGILLWRRRKSNPASDDAAGNASMTDTGSKKSRDGMFNLDAINNPESPAHINLQLPSLAVSSETEHVYCDIQDNWSSGSAVLSHPESENHYCNDPIVIDGQTGASTPSEYETVSQSNNLEQGNYTLLKIASEQEYVNTNGL